jgi:hypothetical protein
MARKPRAKPAPAEVAAVPNEPAVTSYPPRRPRDAVLLGESAILADGQSWQLYPGYFLVTLDEIRDRMFDQWVTGQPHSVRDVVEAGCVLLRLNYELGPDEARLLAYATVGREETASGFATAVLQSLIINYKQNWTYSEWQQTAFLLAGVDAATVPVAKMPAMLAHLIAARRIARPEDFVAVHLGLAYRANLLKAAQPVMVPPGMPA